MKLLRIGRPRPGLKLQVVKVRFAETQKEALLALSVDPEYIKEPGRKLFLAFNTHVFDVIDQSDLTRQHIQSLIARAPLRTQEQLGKHISREYGRTQGRRESRLRHDLPSAYTCSEYKQDRDPGDEREARKVRFIQTLMVKAKTCSNVRRGK